MSRKGRKGQSILEYTLLLAAIIAVIVIVITGTFRPQVKATYERVGGALGNTTNNLNFGVFQ